MNRLLCSIWAFAVLVLAVPQAGATPGGSISGFKWEDLNGDGARQPGEPGLAGWEITLDSTDCYLCTNGSGPIDASTTTGLNGDYSFFGLTTGNYVVGEVLQPGWKQTFPINSIHDICLYTGGTNPCETTAGSASEVNFGNQRIPEPATLALLAAGLAGLGFSRRKN